MLKKRAESIETTPIRHKSDSDDESFEDDLLLNEDHSAHNSPPPPAVKQRRSIRDLHAVEQHDVDAVTHQIGAFFDDSYQDEEEEEQQAGTDSEDSDSDPEDECPILEPNYLSSDDEADYKEPEHPGNKPPNTQIRDNFREYCKEAPNKFMPFTRTQITAIKLMDTLRQKKAPLNAYESLMDWHIRSMVNLKDHERAADSPHYIGRKPLLNMLKDRYNFHDQFPFQRILILPVSGTTTKVSCHKFSATVQYLLTNPKIQEKDWLFFNDHPLAGPPENLDCVADLNTGQAYIQTWHRLVTEEGEQVLPIILYIDGSAVTHFHDFEIIPVKMSLGIFTKEARLKEHMWATLGYIEKVHKVGGRGDDIVATCNHMEDQDHIIQVQDQIIWEKKGKPPQFRRGRGWA